VGAFRGPESEPGERKGAPQPTFGSLKKLGTCGAGQRDLVNESIDADRFETRLTLTAPRGVEPWISNGAAGR